MLSTVAALTYTLAETDWVPSFPWQVREKFIILRELVLRDVVSTSVPAGFMQDLCLRYVVLPAIGSYIGADSQDSNETGMDSDSFNRQITVRVM